MKTVLNIAKTQKRELKKGTAKSFCSDRSCSFQGKKRSKKSESEKRFTQTGIVLFLKRKGSEKSCAQTGIVLLQTPLSSSAASARQPPTVLAGDKTFQFWKWIKVLKIQVQDLG